MTAVERPSWTFLWALGWARGMSTWRLRRLERRYRRRRPSDGDPTVSATLAALRQAMRERGIEPPELI